MRKGLLFRLVKWSRAVRILFGGFHSFTPSLILFLSLVLPQGYKRHQIQP
ncbi:hypothetical protein ES708_09634 [subsurface metagenome]